MIKCVNNTDSYSKRILFNNLSLVFLNVVLWLIGNSVAVSLNELKLRILLQPWQEEHGKCYALIIIYLQGSTYSTLDLEHRMRE